MRRRYAAVFLGTIVAAGFALRLVHLDWGLPEAFEEATPVREAVEFWGKPGAGVTFDPEFFKYPSLTFYLHFFLQAARYLVLSLGGAVESLDDFRQVLSSEFGRAVYHARLLQALLGALLAIPTFLYARRLAGDAAGWGAALLVTVLPLAVRESRLIGPDAALALFAAAALAAVAGVTRTGSRSSYVWAGLWIGLAASAKYPGALLVVALAAAHVQRALAAGRGPAGILVSSLPLQAGVAAFAAFAMTSPYVLLDFPAAWDDFQFEQRHMALGHLGREEGRAFLYYARQGFAEAWTWPAALAAAAGAALLLVDRNSRRAALPGVVFAVVFLGVVGSWTMGAARYLLPLAPLVAAWGTAAARIAAARAPERLRVAAAPVAFLLVAAYPAGTAVSALRSDGREDTRQASLAWIEANVPPGSSLLVERYGPEPGPDRYLVLYMPFHGVEPEIFTAAYSISLYATFDYVVLSDGVGARYRAHPRAYPAQVAFYGELARGFERVAEFPSGRYLGPTVVVLRRRAESSIRDLSGIPESFFDGLRGNGPMANYFAKLGALLARDERADLGRILFRAAVDIGEGDARVWTTVGVAEMQEGGFDAALLALRRARDLDPGSADAAYSLGLLFHRMGETSQAAAAFADAVRLEPGMEAAYIAWAGALVAEVRYAEARGVLQEFLSRFPRSARRADAEAALADLATMGPGRP